MSYQDRDFGLIDYQLCTLDESGPLGLNIPVRKPIPKSSGYVAFIGAAQTFGRYVRKPFGHQLGERLGVEVALIAKGGTGPEYWIEKQPDLMNGLSQASLTIVQVMSARSVTSSFVKNPEWVEVTRNMINEKIKNNEFESLRQYIYESQENYVNQMVKLLDSIPTKKILFWFSQRTPDWAAEFKSARKLWGEFPQMVSKGMMDRIIPHADEYVECVSGVGLPVQLGVDAKGRIRENKYYPSQEMHDAAVLALEPIIKKYLSVAH